jgi:hypothetical protein
MLVGGLRVLLRALSMFFRLYMIALAVKFSGGAVCLCGVPVMFGSFVVFVSCHRKPRFVDSFPAGANSRAVETFPLTGVAAQQSAHGRKMLPSSYRFP